MDLEAKGTKFNVATGGAARASRQSVPPETHHKGCFQTLSDTRARSGR